MLEQLADDPETAARLVAEVGLAGEALAARLRAAGAAIGKWAMERYLQESWSSDSWLDDEDDEDEDDGPSEEPLLPDVPGSPGADALRRWADRAEHLGRYDRGWLCLFVVRLAACPVPPGLGAKALEPLAEDVGLLADDETLWPFFRLLARHLGRLGLAGRTLERVLAQLVAISVPSDDPEGGAALGSLVPAEVEWDILAYNLACFHAVRGERAEMLRHTARSIALGKSPGQFRADGDFAPYLDDTEFVAVLQTVD